LLFNTNHNLKVRGFEIEVFVHDNKEDAVSAGMCPLSGLTAVVNDVAFVWAACTS
jgi:hypothetical protein